MNHLYADGANRIDFYLKCCISLQDSTRLPVVVLATGIHHADQSIAGHSLHRACLADTVTRTARGLYAPHGLIISGQHDDMLTIHRGVYCFRHNGRRLSIQTFIATLPTGELAARGILFTAVR